MFNIEKYLEKFKKNILSSEDDKKQILEIIEKYTKINLLPREVEIKDYIIRIQSSGAIKNKIFIYKDNILKELNSFTKSKIVDIR